MKKSKKILVGIVGAVFLLASLLGAAIAAENTTAVTSAKGVGYKIFCKAGNVKDLITEKLGLSAEELQEERHSGKSLAQIAEEKGVSSDELVEEIISAREKILKEKVEEGIITSEQAERMLENMKTRIAERIQSTERGFGKKYHGKAKGEMNRGRMEHQGMHAEEHNSCGNCSTQSECPNQ